MGRRFSDLRLALRLPLVDELDDGMFGIISGTATYATLKQDITLEFRVFLLLDATLLYIDDNLPSISRYLAAE